MSDHNIQTEPGLCLAINKGITVHPDDVSTPRNFTAFLTPPVNDDGDIIENGNLFKLAVQDKYDKHDVVLLTKMDISIPMKASDLKHHAKNFAGMAGRMFGQTSVQHHKLKQIQIHIEEREVSYNYEFKQDPLFGGNFLDRVNWRYHRFLDSCASGDPDAIELDKLDFSDMLQQVERREYNSKVTS